MDSSNRQNRHHSTGKFTAQTRKLSGCYQTECNAVTSNEKKLKGKTYNPGFKKHVEWIIIIIDVYINSNYKTNSESKPDELWFF